MKKVEGTDRNGISGHQKTKIDFIRLSLNCGKITGGGGGKEQLKERNKVTDEKDNNVFCLFVLLEKRKNKKKKKEEYQERIPHIIPVIF